MKPQSALLAMKVRLNRNADIDRWNLPKEERLGPRASEVLGGTPDPPLTAIKQGFGAAR
jgi:hypothetical protein